MRLPSADTTPRVRGLHHAFLEFVIRARYNPACAGTTFEHRIAVICRTIQPRVCGDYRLGQMQMVPLFDTTPRVRGLLYAHFFRLRNWRYNPACAGTTIIANFNAIVLLIQPRVCGDYNALRFVLFLAVDTTPRVRGLRRQKRAQWPCGRYNPACAGTTQIRWSWMPTHQIQPRVCGDYKRLAHVCTSMSDTTPRVRGLRLLDLLAQV